MSTLSVRLPTPPTRPAPSEAGKLGLAHCTRNGYVPFIDKNGVTQGSAFSNRLFEASDVYNDILLHLKATVRGTATVNIDLDFQNYLSNLENTARAGEATPDRRPRQHAHYDTLRLPGLPGCAGQPGAPRRRCREDWALRHSVHQMDAEAARCRHLHQPLSDRQRKHPDGGGWLGFELGVVGVEGVRGASSTRPPRGRFMSVRQKGRFRRASNRHGDCDGRRPGRLPIRRATFTSAGSRRR